MASERPFEAQGPTGNVLRGDTDGDGPVVLQAHGLTAGRAYVTHGSRALARSGFKSARYDARGHGESDPAPADAGYTYAELAEDMGAVADEVSPGESLVIAGHSMGTHTAAAFALAHPDRVRGLVLAGPASRGEPSSEETIAYWENLAAGLERGGIDGFVEAYDDGSQSPEWREVILRLARRRLALHRDLGAIARALREVTLSVPFDGLESLGAISAPTLVVASRDEADPTHPYATAKEWCEAIPGAQLIVEDDGESPLAWQGGKLSREIASFVDGLE